MFVGGRQVCDDVIKSILLVSFWFARHKQKGMASGWVSSPTSQPLGGASDMDFDRSARRCCKCSYVCGGTTKLATRGILKCLVPE